MQDTNMSGFLGDLTLTSDVDLLRMPLLIRSIWRSVIASPFISLAAVLSLALGIGANTAIFSIVNSLMIRPCRCAIRIDSSWSRTAQVVAEPLLIRSGRRSGGARAGKRHPADSDGRCSATRREDRSCRRAARELRSSCLSKRSRACPRNLVASTFRWK
jgi:hypothetical protein